MRNKDLYNNAMKFVLENKNASVQEIMDATKVSRATAYNVIRDVKTSIIETNEADSPVEAVETVKPSVSIIDDNSVIPDALSEVSEFEHIGDIAGEPEEIMDGKLTWEPIEFTSFCPCCAKKLNYFKTAVCFSHSGKREVVQTFHGICRNCGMSATLQRSRK